MHDPDEPEATESALRRERDLLQAFIDSTPHFFVAIDAEGYTRLMNPAMLDALGYREEEVIGTDYMETFVRWEDREALAEVFERIIRGRQRTLNENHVLTKEGQALLVQWHGTPMFDERGEFSYFFGVGTDITERRRMDDIIADRDARYRAVFAHAPTPMLFTDEFGRILDANAAAEECLGWRAWELRLRKADDFGLPGPTPGTTRIAVPRRSGEEAPMDVRTVAFPAGERTHVLHLLLPPAPEDDA